MTVDTITQVSRQMKTLGFPIVVSCALMYGAWSAGTFIGKEVILPIRDVMADHFKQATKTLEDVGDAAVKTANVQQSNSEVLKAISERSEFSQGFAMDHYELSKQTSQDVQAIKAVVVPRSTGTAN